MPDGYQSRPRLGRPARRRTIDTGAHEHNAALLARQIRVSSGYTDRGPPPPKPAATAAAATEEPPETGPIAAALAGQLYALLLRLAESGDALPENSIGILVRLGVDPGPLAQASTIVNRLLRVLQDHRLILCHSVRFGGRAIRIVATGQVLIGGRWPAGQPLP